MKIPFTSHIGSKIMALVLAVFLWGFAYWRNTEVGSVTCKITFTAPAGLRVEPRNEEISVEVKGPRRKVEDLVKSGTIYINKAIAPAELERFGEADDIPYPVTITAQNVSAESGLTFPDLPRPIELKLRRMTERDLRVDIRVADNPAAGYVYVKEKSYVFPALVTVKGPKSLLDKASYIETQKFYLTGLTASRTEEGFPLVSKINGEDVVLSQDKVSVTVQIEQEPMERVFENILVRDAAYPDYPYNLTITPAAVKVTVSGPASIVGSLRQEEIVVFAQVESELTPAENPYPEGVRVKLPDNLQGLVKVTVDPKTVDIKVEEK